MMNPEKLNDSTSSSIDSFEYELVDISWSLHYDFEQKKSSHYVCDENIIGGQNCNESDEQQFEYDDQGIPKGQSMEEIRKRQQIIGDFFKQWKTENESHQIFNDNLKEYILVRSISVIEACQHSSKSYISTKAALMFEEILKKASKVEIVKPKKDNKNQQNFSGIIIMSYTDEEIGTVRLTVGIRKRTSEKIQYGISAIKDKGTS